jgi:hypothetical protein
VMEITTEENPISVQDSESKIRATDVYELSIKDY